MPSARTFVEDSDEDDNLMSPPRPEDESMSKQGNGRITEDALGGTTNGTNSTGQLESDMQKAHDALFAYEPTLKRGIDNPADAYSHADSPTPESKRRRTTSETGLCGLSTARREQSRFVKTYGQSRSSGRPRTEDGMSAFKALRGDDGMWSSTKRRASHERQLQEDAAAAWNMRGSLLQDFAEHEPVAMFPTNADTESTVPNNTETQRRLVQEAMSAQEQSSIDSKGSPARLSDGSLRSSAFRTTQATNKSPPAMRNSDSSQRSARDLGSSQLLRGTGSPLKQASYANTDAMPPPALNESTPGKRIRRSQSARTPSVPKFDPSPKQHSTTPQASPPARVFASSAESMKEEPIQHQGSHASMRGLHDKCTLVDAEKGSVEASIAHDDNEVQEEVVKPVSAIEPGKRRKKRNEVEALEKLNQAYSEGLSSDDIAAIGLPREQYKPRPSRSRSAQVPEKPVNYSVNPEKASRLRSKRRKTVDNYGSGINPDESPDNHKITAISNMGFTPSRAEKALHASNGNLEDAIDILVSTRPTTAERHVANEIAAALKTYSPERQRSITPTVEVNTELRQPRTESRVVISVAVPSGEANKRKKQDARSLHEDDLPKMLLSDLGNDDSPPRKRGRGRQKQVSTLFGNEDEEDDNDHPINATNDILDKPRTIKRGPGRPRKAVPRDLTEDEAADVEAGFELGAFTDNNSDEEEVPVQNSRPSKKQGRGRPKSAKHNADPISIHCDDVPVHTGDAEPPTARVPSEGSCTTALREVDANSNVAAMTATTESPPPPPPPHGLPQADDPKKTQTATPESSPARPPPPATPAKQRDNTNAQHSPLSKGKVPYRVGLSRKVRIPSLLKVMKK